MSNWGHYKYKKWKIKSTRNFKTDPQNVCFENKLFTKFIYPVYFVAKM